MYENINITLLGGDRRQIYTVRNLASSGLKLTVFGLPDELLKEVCRDGTDNIKYESNIEQAIKDSNIIILPIPASGDGVHINAPIDRDGVLSDVKLSCIIRSCEKETVIIGGKLPLTFVESASQKGIRVYDLLGYEPFEIANAYTTAEAALSIALNSLAVNLADAKVAVSGFGRISKHLSRLLHLMGADVTVAARKDGDLTWARTLGYNTLRIVGDDWSGGLERGYDIIFNTVPCVIFDRNFLNNVSKDTLLVELASVPGGFDLCAANELGANISWALSLPGKYAPESAGGIIAQSVLQIMREVIL